jgi:hypothetical protein
MSQFTDSVAKNFFNQVSEIIRVWPLWVWTILFFLIVIFLQPVQIGIMFWGALKITFGAILGFTVYRVIQKYAMPGKDPTASHEIHWMYIRAILVAAGMFTMGANL